MPVPILFLSHILSRFLPNQVSLSLPSFALLPFPPAIYLHPLPCRPDIATPLLGYGLHFWTFPGRPRRFALIGVYGQFMFVAPDLQLVMVQLSAGADAKNADTDMAQEALALWQGFIASSS